MTIVIPDMLLRGLCLAWFSQGILHILNVGGSLTTRPCAQVPQLHACAANRDT